MSWPWDEIGGWIDDRIIKPIGDAGGEVIGEIGDGAVQIYREADGATRYLVDFSRTSAGQIADWSRTVAGDVADFSVAGYQVARDWAVDRWQDILAMAMTSPPRLGPPDDTARLAMGVLLGAGLSDSVIGAWADDAIAKGYTLAFGFRGTLTAGANGTAYSGIYVDDQGRWGFFAEVGAGDSIVPSLDAALGIEIWMMFGSRADFDRRYFMPGLTLNVPLPGGGEISAGANALINGDFAFKGFRVHGNVSLIPSASPVMPDSGPAQQNRAALGIAERGPDYDAAVRVAQNPGAEGSIVATAIGAQGVPTLQRDWRWCSHCMVLFYSGAGLRTVCPHGGEHSAAGSAEYALWSGAAAQVADPQQDRWRWCRKCGGLHYTDVGLGRCPADGQPHATEGSGPYFVGHSHPAGAGAQAGWRWCSACQALWFGARPELGRCPATGGQHRQDGSADYVLGLAPPLTGTPTAQAGWRWCSRCMVMFHGHPGSRTVCPHGGEHSAAGSADYVLWQGGPAPGSGPSQDGWRWCRKCGGLHHTGGARGRCPADGAGHATEGSAAYYAPHARPAVPGTQANWRWCEHCRGLWWAGRPELGRCPATGGQHSKNGSGDYVIDHR